MALVVRPAAIVQRASQAVLLAFVIGAFQMVCCRSSRRWSSTTCWVDGDASLLTMLMLAMVAVLVFSTVATAVQRYLLSFSGTPGRRRLARLRDLEALVAADALLRERDGPGTSSAELEGMREVRQFLVQHGVAGLMALAQLVLAVAVMLAYSPVLSALFLAAARSRFLMFYSSRRLRPTFEDLEEASSRYRSYQLDAIKGIETVKTMGAEGSLSRADARRVPARRRQALQRRPDRAPVRGAWSPPCRSCRASCSSGRGRCRCCTVGSRSAAWSRSTRSWRSRTSRSSCCWPVGQRPARRRAGESRLNDVFAEEPEQGADRAGSCRCRASRDASASRT